jgi:hypothetical protein
MLFMMGIIVNTDEEFDYAKCFDPGEGKQATATVLSALNPLP